MIIPIRTTVRKLRAMPGWRKKDLKAEVASFALAALEDRLNKTPLPAIPPVDYGANFITFRRQ